MIEKYAGTLTGMFARKVLQKGRENAKLRALVHSQAQKIVELESKLVVSESAVKVAAELLPKRRKKIAEQAKEIERLKAGGLVKPGNSRMLIRNLRRNT